MGLAIGAVIFSGYFYILGWSIDKQLKEEHEADRSNNYRGFINVPAPYKLPDDFPDKKLLARSRLYDQLFSYRYWAGFLIVVALLLGYIITGEDYF